jgi:hypothetical protein
MPYLPLSDFLHKYSGKTAYIIGKGRTKYDYADLAKVEGPVFFINDSVILESNLTTQDSFVFFLDKCQRPWLERPLRSIIVSHHHVCRDPSLHPTWHAHPDNRLIKWTPVRGYISKEQMAGQNQVYTEHGTVTPALSFAFMTGIQSVKLIGCDGLNDKRQPPYDLRIPTITRAIPGWLYHKIRFSQEQFCRHHNIQFEYLGTPDPPPPPPPPDPAAPPPKKFDMCTEKLYGGWP